MLLKTAVVPNLNQFNTHGTSSCTPDSYVPLYSLVGTGNLSTTTSTSSSTYTTSSFTVSSTSPYLVVWASGGQPNLSLDVLSISKIVITKTANAPSFTLPSTTSVVCGSTSSTIFTVTTASNPNNLTITDYTWNLGATPNGWLYNGNPAPATVSTGNTNTITLTPNCGSTLSNISATVTAGGSQYNTNTSTISLTTPPLSITGSNSLCSGSATYSVSGLPCNASVTWSASPSNIVSLSCTSCNSTTITKTGDGNVTLTATVTSATCSNLTSPTKTVSVGNYFPQGTTYATSNYNYYSGTLLSSYSFFLPTSQWGYVSFSITDPNYTSLSWTPISVPSGSSSWSVSGTGNTQLSINIQAIGSAYNSNTCTIRLSAQGPCGSYTQDFSATAVVRGWGFMVSPNPASSELTVSAANTQDKSSLLIYAIKILDQSGVVRKSFEYKQGVSSARIPIAELKQGTYHISVFDGKEWSSKPVIIQK